MADGSYHMVCQVRSPAAGSASCCYLNFSCIDLRDAPVLATVGKQPPGLSQEHNAWLQSGYGLYKSVTKLETNSLASCLAQLTDFLI